VSRPTSTDVVSATFISPSILHGVCVVGFCMFVCVVPISLPTFRSHLDVVAPIHRVEDMYDILTFNFGGWFNISPPIAITSIDINRSEVV